MNIGHSIRLSPREVEQAVREHVRRLAESRGIQTPKDTLDFHNRTAVHFVGPSNLAVNYEAVVVTWEE